MKYFVLLVLIACGNSQGNTDAIKEISATIADEASDSCQVLSLLKEEGDYKFTIEEEQEYQQCQRENTQNLAQDASA